MNCAAARRSCNGASGMNFVRTALPELSRTPLTMSSRRLRTQQRTGPRKEAARRRVGRRSSCRDEGVWRKKAQKKICGRSENVQHEYSGPVQFPQHEFVRRVLGASTVPAVTRQTNLLRFRSPFFSLVLLLL